MTAPHERVVVVKPPPDCDFGGVWLVVDGPGRDSIRRRCGADVRAPRADVRVALLQSKLIIAVGQRVLVLADARDLDWSAAKEAAARIIRICDDAGFTAPEALDVLRGKIVLVCAELGAIVTALKITPPGARP